MKLQIEEASTDEIEKLMAVEASEEGWIYNPSEINAYSKFTGTKFYVVKNEENNRIGGVAVSYRGAILSIGLFIITSGNRGQGYGQRVLEELLSRHSEYPLACLNSVRKAQSLYSRCGFFATNAGTMCYKLDTRPSCASTTNLNAVNIIINEALGPILINNFCDSLIGVDVNRSNALALLIAIDGAMTFCYSDPTNSAMIGGFAIVLPTSQGNYKIEPLYSLTLKIGLAILQAIISYLPAAKLELNAPFLDNISNHDSLSSLGFERDVVGDTKLMLTNKKIRTIFTAFFQQVIATGPLEFPPEILTKSTINDNISSTEIPAIRPV